MRKEEAIERVKPGSRVIYEGATSDICIGIVETVSKNGCINVHDEDNSGHYYRSPEEYFLYEVDEDDWYLQNQKKYNNRDFTKEEFFWYKLCKQNSRLMGEYRDELERKR